MDRNLMAFKLTCKENMLVNSKIIKNKERANIGGIMESTIMVNGQMEKNMDMECGQHLMEIIILVNGLRGKLKAKEFILQ